MKGCFVFLLACAILASPASATQTVVDLQQLGPYHLGVSYDSLKTLPGFTLDEKRSDPAENIVAAKIIDKSIANTPTIQRFTFKSGYLVRISIIFHPPDIWTEDAVKAWLIPQWGDPGVKESCGSDAPPCYTWRAPRSIGFILPADGGRSMAQLRER
ncbi:MAG: hypothetical protein NVS9B12_00410 [Vulcanimicrobiaceae bacterium]